MIESMEKYKGNVLLINVRDKKILDKVYNNKKIKDYVELNEIKKGKKKYKQSKDNKSVKINKLVRYFGKDSIDYTIVDIKDITRYYKTIIKSLVTICKHEVIIYGIAEDYYGIYFKRVAKRYNVVIKEKDDHFIIDLKDAKRCGFKEVYYSIYDTLYSLFDFLGTMLMQ